MTDTKHTPTPWPTPAVYKKRKDGSLILSFGDPLIGYHEQFDLYASENIAAHIVKCVNMHEELVEVLEGVLDGIQRGYSLGYLEDEVEKTLKKAGAL